MASIASERLNDAKSLADVEYLYGAAMSALLTDGREEEAHALFLRFNTSIPPDRHTLGWFRWIQSTMVWREIRQPS
jgi:hypothetical protein